MLTAEQLKKIMPHAPASRRAAALPILNDVAKAYDINNERRMAAWLATLAVESGELKYQEEIASGAAYEGRKDLGNTEKGDGRRFKGHGRIQITGRSNHTLYTNYLKRSKHLPFIDFVAEPHRLAEEPYATDSAGWFWAVYKKLNALADAGDFLTTQIRVNGRNKKTGLPNHWKERNNYFLKALSVLPANFTLSAADASVPDPNNTPDELKQKKAPADTQKTPDPQAGPSEEAQPPIIQQTAEQIINTGNQAEAAPTTGTVEIEAPGKDGTTAASTKMTIMGLTVPPTVYAVFQSVSDWIEKGYIDVKEIITGLGTLLRDNYQYVFGLIGLVIGVLVIKKILKQITFLFSMWTAANPNLNTVKIVPATPEPPSKWWQIWK